MAHLRLHADDGEMVDSVFANRHQQIVNQRKISTRKLYANVANEIARWVKGRSPCRGSKGRASTRVSFAYERKYDDETTAGACRGLDGDDGRN